MGKFMKEEVVIGPAPFIGWTIIDNCYVCKGVQFYREQYDNYASQDICMSCGTVLSDNVWN